MPRQRMRRSSPNPSPAAAERGAAALSLPSTSPGAYESYPEEQMAELEANAAAAAAVEGADTSAGEAAAGGRRRLLASAGIIGIGTLLSSLLGFVRIEVLNVLFYGAVSGAFVAALRPIQMISDLLVGGSVSGALIPTFVDHGAPEQRDELRRIYSTVVNVVLVVMGAAAIAILFAAPAFVPVLTKDFTPQGRDLTVTLVRVAAFSLFGLGLYAATSALLYGLKEVIFPAFATGMYHIGIVVCGVAALLVAAAHLGVPLGDVLHSGTASSAVEQARLIGARGLAIGAAAGALCEFLILIPGMRRVRVSWRPVLDLRHPAVRRIFLLYAPIAAGLLLSVGQQVLDAALAGRTPGGAEGNITALATGTTLTQFPIGLVVAALSFAVLPALTSAATRADMPEFKSTLVLGIRFGLLLMIPAMIGLIVLRVPILAMLFQHGTCDRGCTVRNALAVQNYGLQLPFIAVDQLMIAAFYARKNTITPVLVTVISILCYVAVAVPFSHTVGMPALAFGDTVKNASHALILVVLLTISIGDLGARALLDGIGRILVASAAMALVCWGLLRLLPAVALGVFDVATARGNALIFVVAGGLGAATYFAVANWLKIDEVRLIGGVLKSKLGGRR